MVTERRLIWKLLSALDTSQSLSQDTVVSLNSYQSRIRVKLTLFVRSVDRISASRTAGGTTQKHAGTKKHSTAEVIASSRCLVYYFLLFLDPNLTIAYLAMLAGLQKAICNKRKVSLRCT